MSDSHYGTTIPTVGVDSVRQQHFSSNRRDGFSDTGYFIRSFSSNRRITSDGFIYDEPFTPNPVFLGTKLCAYGICCKHVEAKDINEIVYCPEHKELLSRIRKHGIILSVPRQSYLEDYFTKKEEFTAKYTATKDDIKEELTCSICLEPIDLKSKASILPCSHKFHTKCISEWIKKKKNCPYCKYE